MDPVMIGEAAVAYLAARAAGKATDDITSHALSQVKRLRELIHSKLAGDDQAISSLAAVEAMSATQREYRTLADALTAGVQTDPVFQSELQSVVEDIEKQFAIDGITTNIAGHARIQKMAIFGRVQGDVRF